MQRMHSSPVPQSPLAQKKQLEVASQTSPIGRSPSHRRDKNSDHITNKDEVGLTRTSSLILSPTKTRNYDSTISQARIFPGIVHERHRRSSIRQGSGSETDGDSMSGSWMSGDKKRPKSMEVTDGSLQEAVLEEAAEDT